MAGVKVKQANPNADVLILEKANIRCGGAIPGFLTSEKKTLGLVRFKMI
ncbi:hypothetical protein [Nostoc sp.]